ncbi:MAG: electron transfer flavoprotein subunit beta/FixA family protein [Planctomycetes bacterium]|nr:electron transfer flavoprotein subunit beta/FixA family protein [Planctomycetota bacterium]
MKIVACIKRVPTTEAQVKVSADQKGLDTAGLSWMTSFYDELAVEEAIRSKEKHGGDVTVLTLGPSEASKDVREFLARGADAGVILKDDQWHARDARATAKILCARIQKAGAELVFLGKLATDRDNGAVGPMIATMLGWACVTDVVALELNGTQGSAKRETEQGIETVAFALPAVITCQKGLNEPRRANLKGIMAVKAKAIPEESFEDVPNQQQVQKVEPPPARKAGRIVGEGAAAVQALVDALRNEAGVI